MPKVLTMPNTVSCGHPPPPGGGTVATASSAKLRVNGNAVLLKDSIVGKPVASCGTPPASDALGPTATKCLSVASVTAGESLKLKAGGQPVILDTLKGTTDGMVAKTTPQALLTATPNQTKLNAV